jgi:hypothetical protein
MIGKPPLTCQRQRKLLSCVIALVVLALAVTPVFGWNSHGHRTVAAVSWSKLTPKTKARITELLKLNPYYGKWEEKVPKGATQDEHDEIIFIMAATWPDEIRARGSGYVHDSPKLLSATPSDYADKKLHTYWHFYDRPLSVDGTPLPAVATPNALTAIAFHQKTLTMPGTSDEQKSYALVWLLHLVGDIHQPLHASTRVSKQHQRGDLGGNRIAILDAGHEHAQDLHEFWDNILGTSTAPRVAITLASKLPAADANKATIADPQQWADESYLLAVDRVYVDPIGKADGPYRITDAYRAIAESTAKEQAAVAGARLAMLLNKEFGGAASPSATTTPVETDSGPVAVPPVSLPQGGAGHSELIGWLLAGFIVVSLMTLVSILLALVLRRRQ